MQAKNEAACPCILSNFFLNVNLLYYLLHALQLLKQIELSNNVYFTDIIATITEFTSNFA